MSLPVPIKDIKDEPALGQSLREIVRRAADATQYQKLIGPIEIAKTLTVNGLLRGYDILANNLSTLGAVVTNNLDVVGSATVERLGVAARATIGELEVYGPAFFNGAVSFSTALASMVISRLEVRAGLIVGGLASISSAVINQLSVLGQADIGNLDVRGTTATERAAVADRLTAGTLEVYGSANFNTKPVIAGLTANRVVQTDSAGAIATPAALANGQILIGSTGAAPVAAAITGTANQITVATGAGSTTLSTPQDIATSSSPTFSDLTLSGHVANRIVVTGTGGAIDDAAALTNGQILIGSTGAAPVAATITGTANQVNVAVAAGSTTLSTPQNIDTAASPTFSDLTLSSHVANRIVVTGTGGAIDDAAALSNGQLLIGSTSAAPVGAALTGTANQVAVTNGAGSITLSAPQDIATTSSPTFATLTLTNLVLTTRTILNGFTTILDAAVNRLSVLGMADIGNLDVRGSTTTERLGVSARATVGELEVYGDAFFNRAVNFAQLIGNILTDRLEVRTRAIFGGFTTILDATINRLSVLGMLDAGNILARGAVQAERLVASDKATMGDLEVFGKVYFSRNRPTMQVFTSGSSATYTTPTGIAQLRIRIVGGGGGGQGVSNGVGYLSGGAGGNTTFGSVTANGGTGGSGTTPAAGGSGGAGTAQFRIPGGAGQGQGGSTSYNVPGGSGGCSSLGGNGGGGGAPGINGGDGATNSGGGGGGAGGNTAWSSVPCAGGGGGEYAEFYINNPAATYTYTVGAGGTKGNGVSAQGGTGAAGIIIVEEYYF